MLTDKILENDNIIVTVPDYLLEENQEEPSQEEESLEEEENLEEEEEGNQEEEENQEEPIIYVESNFDETNIMLELESLKQVQMYNLSFNAGIFTFLLLFLCVRFFKIFF